MADIFKKHHDSITERYGEKFCAAPFTSLHQLGEGLVTTCCKTRVPIGNSNTHTYEEIMNSDHAKEVRAQFLRGEKPEQCKVCWEYEDNNSWPANNRVFSNYSARTQIDDAVRDTLPDGTLVKQHPAWMDMLWTNKCNFACLGCTPELSTTIAKKFKKEFAVINGIEPDRYHPEIQDEWKMDNSAKIDYIIKHSDTITKIHLNGGEPFMQEDVYELLDALLKRGLEKQITIWAHTNGSIIKYKGVDLVEDYLKYWGKNCKITISNDHYGTRGEYIRWGYKHTKWVDAYNRFFDAGLNLGIQTCYSLLNALTVEDMGLWFYENLPKPLYGSLTLWTDHRAYDPRLLQLRPELLERAVQQLRNLKSTGYRPEHWQSNIEGHINYMQSPLSEERLREKARNFLQGTIAIDQARSTDFDATFPELSGFRNDILKIAQ